MVAEKLLDQVEIPMHQAASAFVPGATVFSAHPRLWEVQVWFRDCGLFASTPYPPADFLSFEVALTIDEFPSQVRAAPPVAVVVANGERVWPGPRGVRRQIWAQSVSIVGVIGSGVTTSLRMVTRIGVAPGITHYQPQVLINEGLPGTPFPRYATEFRFLNRPGATYTLLDSAGASLVDNVQTYALLPVAAAMDWRPIHWLAAGFVSGDADLLYCEVR
jgi:hypothetical protein